jgi:cadmium resistance protein CadD (predicted permease)
MSGGDASQLWLPYFEANLDTTMQAVGIFVIIYFVLMIVASGLLLKGIRC